MTIAAAGTVASIIGLSARPLRTIHIGGRTLKVEIADSEAERQIGLGGRSGLAYGRGMLFQFDRPDRHGIWMRRMKFSLDAIWLDQAGRVIEIAHNIPPSSYPASFEPPVPAKFIIEVPTGWTRAAGIRLGDQANVGTYDSSRKFPLDG